VITLREFEVWSLHCCSISLACFRRVHITKATLLQLNGRFQVEAVDSGQKEGYLADHKVETYLIVPPAVSTKCCVKNTSSGMWRTAALVRTDVSEERVASIMRLETISKLRTKQAVTSKLPVPPKRWSLQESHGVTCQKTPFFIVTSVRTSYRICYIMVIDTGSDKAMGSPGCQKLFKIASVFQ
jgi:hypothetical protein